MKIEYNNLYTHFIFTTFGRIRIIPEKNVLEFFSNQPEHHKKQSFSEEYEQFLKHYQDTIKK